MTIKEIGKTVVGHTASNPLAWPVYRACGRVSGYLARVYGHAHYTLELGERDERMRKLAAELFPDLTVAGGPFQGMRYPSAQPFGSALLPKLLGSYESELHPFLNELLVKKYTSIVDIGCGEGYYAVGLALRFPNTPVYAFDTNPHARRLCSEMVDLNGVSATVQIGDLCDQAALNALPLGDKALIVCDCEGYERVLFTPEIAAHLAKHDLIVEAHDFIDIDISQKLRRALATTHHVRSVKSLDDIEKVHTYIYRKLEPYDSNTRKLIVGERRPAIMEWFIMTAREQAGTFSQPHQATSGSPTGSAFTGSC